MTLEELITEGIFFRGQSEEFDFIIPSIYRDINYIKNVVPGPIGNPNNAQIIANAVHPNKNAIDIGIIVDIKLPTPNSFLYFWPNTTITPK